MTPHTDPNDPGDDLECTKTNKNTVTPTSYFLKAHANPRGPLSLPSTEMSHKQSLGQTQALERKYRVEFAVLLGFGPFNLWVNPH